MRQLCLVLALAAALAFPIASLADDVAGDEGGGEASRASAAEGEGAGGADAAEPEEEEVAAADEPEAEEEEEDEEEPTAFDEYLASVVERALTGLNGLLTAPADPPLAAIEPPDALEDAGYARHPLGFASGVLLMGYRTLTGAVDLGLAIFPKLPVLSPVPRLHLIPGFEHEDE